MILRIRTMVMALFCATVISALLSLGATTASAQPIAWNPPCAFTKIVNTTACPAKFLISTNFGNVTAGVAAGGTAPVAFPGGTIINGVFTQAGTFVPLTSPGPIIPPPGPGTPSAGWVSSVTLGPAPGCCFDVYFEQPPGANGCYIWLLPGTGTCIP